MVIKLCGRVVVLMYHAIDSADEPSELTNKGDLIYVVGLEDFNAQMSYIAEQEIAVVVLEDCVKTEHSCNLFSNGVSVILTFDDGHITNYSRALPALKRFGLKGYFFITTDWIGCPYYMNEEMLKRLHDCGMLIGSHGKTHRFLSDLTDNEIRYELEMSKTRLEHIIEAEVSSLSLPGGRASSRIVHLAKDIGYSYIFDSEPLMNTRSEKRDVLGRFAMRRGQDFSEYVKIVTGNVPLLNSLKYKALKYAKTLMGTNKYTRLRNIVIGDQ